MFLTVSLISLIGWDFIVSYELIQKLMHLTYHLCYAIKKCKQFRTSVKVCRVFPYKQNATRIFTGISISLDKCLRQQQSRYVIHAGWNLPIKVFRYLRTVRVTAAIRYYLYSVLQHLLFMSQHWANVRPNIMFRNISQSCVFNKQSLCSISCCSIEPSFFLSYGIILQSSLNILLLKV